MVVVLYLYILTLMIEDMNKNVTELYNKVLAVVLNEYEITAEELFHSNNSECVQAREVLIVTLNKKGLSDKEIAECTQKMRRCSVCKIHNRFNPGNAPWSVKICLEHLKSL